MIEQEAFVAWMNTGAYDIAINPYWAAWHAACEWQKKQVPDGWKLVPIHPTEDMQPVSMETMTRAMKEIDLLPKPDQWIVIDPQGRTYKGKVEQVLPVLTAAHPFFKTPLAFGAMWPNGDG